VSGSAFGPLAKYVGDATHQAFWRSRSELAPDHVAIVEREPRAEELLNEAAEIMITSVGEEERTPLTRWQWTPDLYRESFYQLRARSSLTLPLVEQKSVRGLAGMFWTAPRSFSRIEIETAKTVAAIVAALS
jgi:hypothetical protein